MTRKLLLSFAGVGVAVVMAAATAQAAPATGAADPMRSYAQDQRTVQDVRWRHRCHNSCWWHHGRRHCRRVCNRRGW
jgi:hypothetical protein